MPNNLISNINNNKIIKKDILEYEYDETAWLGSYDNVLDICFYDLSIYQKNYDILVNKSLKKYSALGEDFIDELGVPYGCAVVAILNVAAQNNLFTVRNAGNSQYYKSAIKAEYLKIWSWASPYNGDVDATLIGKIVDAYGEVECKKTVTYTDKKNPTIGFFTNAVDSNRSSILGAIGDLDGKKAGHAFNVIGYLTYKRKSDSRQKTLLKVATGWGYDNDIGYIDYENLNLRETYGSKFVFK